MPDYDKAIDYGLELLRVGEPEHKTPEDFAERLALGVSRLEDAAAKGNVAARDKLAQLHEILDRARRRKGWADELRNRFSV